MYGTIVLAAMQILAQTPDSPFRLVPRTRLVARPVEPAPVGDVVLVWNEETLRTIRDEQVPPPKATRTLAMVHGAMYDAVNAVGSTHTHFLVNARPNPGTSAESAAAVAAHQVLSSLHPARREGFDLALARSLAQVPDGPGKEEGVALGQFVAGEMLKWRANDGSTRQVALRPGDGPGAWKPTPPDYQPGLLPQWSEVKPFALPDPSRFRPPAPPPLDSAEYVAAYREVKALGGEDSTIRTAEQTEIARFWEDGVGTVTPPGHWNRIAQQVARDRGTTLADNARLFALLNFALADAAIACWECKYRFSLWRPIHAIRESTTDGDVRWKPLLPTPPFPAYTSGHSSFSSSGAAVLAEFFGTDAVRFSTTSEGLPGVTRTYTSFSSAAAEAGQSRIYGGIHWQFDNTAGLESGRKIGEFVTRHWLTPRQVP